MKVLEKKKSKIRSVVAPGAKVGVEVGRERVEGNCWDDGNIFVESCGCLCITY